MTHPQTQVRPVRREIGVGVFATKDLPRGTLVWARDALDQVVTEGQRRAYPAAGRELLQRYVYRDDSGALILCWDNARFMNHACEPKSLVTPFGFSIIVRDVAAGEEITEDYATYHLAAEETFDCYCGLDACRKRVGPNDVAPLTAGWARVIGEALERVGDVPQPLLPLVGRETLAAAAARYRILA